MTVHRQSFWSRMKLKPRERRMLLYLSVLLGFAAWKFFPRPWHPTTHLQTRHHAIESTASAQQTEDTAIALTALYTAYLDRFASLPSLSTNHPLLKVKLYKDRSEFRRINPGLGWAEAFYRKPYCRAYYSSTEANPFHWMVHEAAHQLNTELAGLELEKWLEEGLADYYGSSLIVSNRLLAGRVDAETYPVWWIDELATHPTLEENLRNGSVIPLRAIVTGSGGPSLNRHVNLYYLHWWTLTQFIFEDPKHRAHAIALVKDGGGLKAFEKHIGRVDDVQVAWHGYVRALKKELAQTQTLGRRERMICVEAGKTLGQ